MNGGAPAAAERDRLPDPGAGFVWDVHDDGVPLLRPLVDRVLAAFTTRVGGVSSPPFDTLNLGHRVGDSGADVVENGRRAAALVGAEGWSGLRQVHGARVVRATREASPEADGAWTDDRDDVLAVKAADCVPVLLAGDGRLGAAHAGWRGCVAGIVENAVGTVHATVVVSGPAIGPCCFEVGSEVVSAFRDRFGATVVADERHVDLWTAVEVAASEAGADDIRSARLCTSCHPELFFSHRRDRGRTGRHALLARLGG